MIRRALLAGLLAAASMPAFAQTGPTGPVKMIVPSAPGGLSDPVVRFLGEHFQKAFGQPLLMVHQPGGGGIVGPRPSRRPRPTAPRCCWATSARWCSPPR